MNNHGILKSRTPEYRVWIGIRRRCFDPSREKYHLYGGRGITVCQRWNESFDDFLSDMGHRPSPKHQIDRINTDGNYEPSNCRWATVTEQIRNRRNSLVVTAFGKTLTIAEWSEITGLSYPAILFRVNSGWDAERALTLGPGATRLSPGKVLEIKALKGIKSQRSIAQEFGISPSSVHLIHKGKYWKRISATEISGDLN